MYEKFLQFTYYFVRIFGFVIFIFGIKRKNRLFWNVDVVKISNKHSLRSEKKKGSSFIAVAVIDGKKSILKMTLNYVHNFGLDNKFKYKN